MVRRVQLVWVLTGLLAACGGSRDRGPAWPAPSPSETDGGESLAPRHAGSVAAIEKAEDARPAAAAEEEPAKAGGEAGEPAATEPAPSSEPADAASAREAEILEELLIEIEED